jgi:hypothetical protein
VLKQATGNSRLTRLTTARTRGKPPPSPIYYTLHHSRENGIQMDFCPGTPISKMGVSKSPRLEVPQLRRIITSNTDLRLGRGLNQSCNSPWELSNGLSHATCTQGNRVNSQLPVVGSQTVNLTPVLSFGHNLCCRCPNGSCKPILDIYTSITFQWYKELPNARLFDPSNRTLNFWESRRTPKFPFRECESHPHTLSK